MSIANTIVEYYTTRHPEEPEKIELSRDPRLLEFLVSKGFTKIFRSYRYWTRKADELFGSEDFLSEYEHERLYTRNMGDSDTDDDQILSILETAINKHIKKMFDDGIEISPNMNLGLESPMETI